MGVTLAKWSLDEYHRMIAAGAFAGRNVQLVLGEIVEMAPEGPFHANSVDCLANYLSHLFAERALVREGHPVILPSNGEPEPDVAVVVALGAVYRERHPGPEDIYLAVEVSHSTLDYDLTTKAKMYALDGVREYWVMDIERQQVWVHRQPVDGVYTFRQMHTSGTLSPEAFPDVEIAVEKLFA